MSVSDDLERLFQILGHRFANIDLLREALTHPSVERPKRQAAANYQRLEFLGDRVLGLVIAEQLYRRFPEAAAGELAGDGWEIEVVDLRSVKPLDTDTVIASVARTGRLLCVGEAWPWGGVTAEVIARVTTDGYGLLDAPPQRLNAKDTPVPYHRNLWTAHRPTAHAVGDAARKILRR